jgi:hypothetical protein
MPEDAPFVDSSNVVRHLEFSNLSGPSSLPDFREPAGLPTLNITGHQTRQKMKKCSNLETTCQSTTPEREQPGIYSMALESLQYLPD